MEIKFTHTHTLLKLTVNYIHIENESNWNVHNPKVYVHQKIFLKNFFNFNVCNPINEHTQKKIIYQRISMDFFFFVRYLDLAEVHRFADELIVFGQLLARGKLDKDLAQLSAAANVQQRKKNTTRTKMSHANISPHSNKTSNVPSAMQF